MWAAVLGCTPYYTDWSTYVTVHVYGDRIVLDGTCNVRVLNDTCDCNDQTKDSAPLTVIHTASGDVVGTTYTSSWCSAPQDVIDFVDISAVVEK